MRAGLPFLILGVGVVAAVLAATMIGGKQVPALAVVEMAMPPHLAPPAPPPTSVAAPDTAPAPDARTAAGAVASPKSEALASATPAGDQPPNGAATPTEPAAPAAADPKINGELPMVVTRGSNMRAEPSVTAPLVAHFKAGERVYRMEEKAVLGYYLVRSDKATGWIWWMNVAEEQQQPPSP